MTSGAVVWIIVFVVFFIFYGLYYCLKGLAEKSKEDRMAFGPSAHVAPPVPTYGALPSHPVPNAPALPTHGGALPPQPNTCGQQESWAAYMQNPYLDHVHGGRPVDALQQLRMEAFIVDQTQQILTQLWSNRASWQINDPYFF